MSYLAQDMYLNYINRYQPHHDLPDPVCCHQRLTVVIRQPHLAVHVLRHSVMVSGDHSEMHMTAI